MRQAPLFGEEDESPGRVMQAVQPTAPSQPATPEQKKFRKLVAKIESVRTELATWQAYLVEHRKRYAVQAAPLMDRYREKQIEMVHLLDRHMSDPQLKKTHRRQVAEMLTNMLARLISEEHDDALVRLYDKHSDVPFAEETGEEEGMMRSVVEEIFGIDMKDVPLDSPEAMAKAFAAKFGLGGADDKAARQPRKKSAKALAKEAKLAEAEQGATKSVREVFRQLASALHPDREQDPAERARKTALMQEANRAYDARDLLALLELQLRIEQIAPRRSPTSPVSGWPTTTGSCKSRSIASRTNWTTSRCPWRWLRPPRRAV